MLVISAPIILQLSIIFILGQQHVILVVQMVNLSHLQFQITVSLAARFVLLAHFQHKIVPRQAVHKITISLTIHA